MEKPGHQSASRPKRGKQYVAERVPVLDDYVLVTEWNGDVCQLPRPVEYKSNRFVSKMIFSIFRDGVQKLVSECISCSIGNQKKQVLKNLKRTLFNFYTKL